MLIDILVFRFLYSMSYSEQLHASASSPFKPRKSPLIFIYSLQSHREASAAFLDFQRGKKHHRSKATPSVMLGSSLNPWEWQPGDVARILRAIWHLFTLPLADMKLACGDALRASKAYCILSLLLPYPVRPCKISLLPSDERHKTNPEWGWTAQAQKGCVSGLCAIFAAKNLLHCTSCLPDLYI